MEALATQDESEISISVPKLGKDALLLHRMTAKEEIGRLFEYELELLSTDHNLTLQDVLGQNLTVTLQLPEKEKRFFNGHVSRFTYAGRHGRYAHYRCTVRPWLWFLTLRTDCRIYQEQKVPEIIEETIRRHGFADFEDQLVAEYRNWDYNVQYRETDFAYISRLMEQEGIYYYFKHEDGKHVLVLADGVTAHRAAPGYESVPFVPVGTEGEQIESVSDWLVSQQVEPAAIGFRDFDFRGPRDKLETKISTLAEFQTDGVPSQSELEIYDYPGEYESLEEGEAYARVRMEELEAQYEVVEGRTNARGLAVGSLFTLADHPRSDADREYLILSARYELHSNAYESATEEEAEAEPTFTCSFRAIDSGHRYRSPRTTPLPLVRGPQTATVVGPKDEKVWPDKYGRVKVHFHWDRYQEKDENSSCWIRVSQGWAGGGWGGMHIPHVGQEVVVEFLEGDPDRPIITGRVYNAGQMPPLELPEHKHKSILRDDYGNQIVFDATPGEEHISLYSPHHDSGMEIGSSVVATSNSNTGELFAGSKTDVLAGVKSETIGGFATSGLLGYSNEFKIGSSLDAMIGSTISYKAAYNYELSDVDTVKNANKDWMQLVNGDAILDCEGEKKQKLVLCAGANRESMLEMGEKELVLKVGSGKRSTDPLTNSAEWAMRVSVALAAVAHSANAISALAHHTAKEDRTVDAANLLASLATHDVVAAAHLAAFIALGTLYVNQSPDKIKKEIKSHKHKARIRISKRGSIGMEGKRVKIESTSKNTTVTGKVDLKLIAGRTVMTKGKFNHPNFTILP